MNEPTILLIEDEAPIRQLIKFGLAQYHYQFDEADSIQAAYTQVAQNRPDLVLLDWMLPDGNGIEVIHTLSADEHLKHIPILMLTARAAEHDVVKALDQGADDYITKPFSMAELHSRIKALLRRSTAQQTVSNYLQWKDVHINLDTYQVQYQGQEIKLHRREYYLLKAFLETPGKVLSREQLLNAAWGEHTDVGDRAVDVSIRRLRKAFAVVDYELPIATIRGIGYRLDKLSEPS